MNHESVATSHRSPFNTILKQYYKKRLNDFKHDNLELITCTKLPIIGPKTTCPCIIKNVD
jgi:hypothetical protein